MNEMIDSINASLKSIDTRLLMLGTINDTYTERTGKVSVSITEQINMLKDKRDELVNLLNLERRDAL